MRGFAEMLPLALANAGWAVIGAVSGALIGAVAGTSADAVLLWRRESKLARAGARLVAAEIAAADSQLASVEQEGKWWRFHGTPIDNWPEYKGILAVKLPREAFEAVSQGVMVLEGLRQQMPLVPAFQTDPNRPYLDVDPDDVKPVRLDAAKAYNALASLAGHEREGELIKRVGRS